MRPPVDALAALRASLTERLAALRGVPQHALPESLLDVVVRRTELPGGDLFHVCPAGWEALRHDEGGAGRPVPYWATPWPSGIALARAVAAAPPPAGARVVELGCGLALPAMAAARAGATVLATDGSTDAVAFAAHAFALNELEGDVAHADWAAHGDALVERGPWDVVLAADVAYRRDNVQALLRLLPRLLAPGGEVRLADPNRAGARDLLAAARGPFAVTAQRGEDVSLYALRRRGWRGATTPLSAAACPPGT